jgi:hypothetical protein
LARLFRLWNCGSGCAFLRDRVADEGFFIHADDQFSVVLLANNKALH